MLNYANTLQSGGINLIIIMIIMVIFKRLSVKDLSALQDDEGEGGMG